MHAKARRKKRERRIRGKRIEPWYRSPYKKYRKSWIDVKLEVGLQSHKGVIALQKAFRQKKPEDKNKH